MRLGRPPLVARAGITALAVFGALLLSPGAARGQEAAATHPRASHWWVGAGGGVLFTHADCINCDGQQPLRDTGSLVLLGGLRVHERLLVGGEFFGTRGTSSELVVGQLCLLAVAQFRPSAAHGFFVKGGLGTAVVRDALPAGSPIQTGRSWGMSVMYGAGWVFGQGRRMSIAPMAAQYVTAVGGVRTSAGTAQNLVMNSWFVGAVLMIR